MAKDGEKYIAMPYVIKGMDLSFTGILSYCEDLVISNRSLAINKELPINDSKGISKWILKKK